MMRDVARRAGPEGHDGKEVVLTGEVLPGEADEVPRRDDEQDNAPCDEEILNGYVEVDENLVPYEDKTEGNEEGGDDRFPEHPPLPLLVEVHGKAGVEGKYSEDVEGDKDRNEGFEKMIDHEAWPRLSIAGFRRVS